MNQTVNKILKVIGVIFALLYPFCVFLLLNSGVSMRFMSLLLLVLVLSGFLRSQKKIFLCVGLVLILGLLIFDNDLFLRLYPVCMNALICFSFLISLRGKPLITVFAEKMGNKATPEMLSYTKKATVAWGVFMFINTAISFFTLFLPLDIWTLYNGLISYILIGMMFGIEYLIRRRCMRESI